MSYIEITAVNGVRNDVSPERFAPGDLVYARNVDIDESGKATRRAGTSVVFPGPAHSVWSDGQQGFFAQDSKLYRFLADGTKDVIATGIEGPRVRYVNVNGTVYWTDGLVTGAFFQNENAPWGITPPAPIHGTDGKGTLPAGTYLCTMTYVGADGRESGASTAIGVPVGNLRPKNDKAKELATGSVSLSGLTPSNDPRVTHKNIYVGAFVPLLVATIPNSQTSMLYAGRQLQTVPARTSFMSPPPAGQVIGYYNSRVYVAVGNFLLFSQPFEYDLFDLRTDFLAFDSDIQTFAAVTDGIFIGTRNRTVFLSGHEPDKFQSRAVAPHGTVLGTEQVVSGEVLGKSEDGADPGRGTTSSSALWMSQRGLVVGQDGGTVRDLTAKRFIPPAASSGAAFLKRRSGTPLYVISLFN